jgi:hypothetical protein
MLSLGIFQQKMPLLIGILLVGADAYVADGFCGFGLKK